MNRTDIVELMDRMEADPEVPYMVSYQGQGQYQLSVSTYPGKKLTDDQAAKVIGTFDDMKLHWEAGIFGVLAF